MTAAKAVLVTWGVLARCPDVVALPSRSRSRARSGTSVTNPADSAGFKSGPTAQVTVKQAKTGYYVVSGWNNTPEKRCTWNEVLVFVNDTGLVSRPIYQRGSVDPCGRAPTGARGYTLADSGILSMGHAGRKLEFVRKPGA
ncbi:hypothetical protein [Streptomyces sp. NPDC053720]|uniref:hypothetical protein n=1 Tax=Streptomyces sp. NPDC053720 TaxID=3154855 RepID=UPI00342A3458